MKSRYEKLMSFSHNKQLDEIKDNLLRLEKTKQKKVVAEVPKKVMFSEDVVIKQ